MRLRDAWEVLEPLLEELEPELVAVIGCAMRAAYMRGRCDADDSEPVVVLEFRP
jgi:hypothetical protein